MPRNPFSSSEQRRKREQQHQLQQSRNQAALANSYSGSHHPQTTDDARQNPRLGTDPSSFGGSKPPPLPSKSSHSSYFISQNRTQRTPEHRIESVAPVTGERGRYVISENWLSDEEQRGASCNHFTNTTPVAQYQKPSNHRESRDQGRQVLAKDYPNSETRSANSERLDSKVINAPRQSIENPSSHGSHHLQATLGDKSKVPEVNSPRPDMVTALPSSKNSKDPNTGDDRFQGDDYRSGSVQCDASKRNEVSHDESLHAGGITRRPVNGEYQQQWSEKPARLSTNRVDQVQHNEEMQKLQNDHAIEMKKPREKQQVEVAMPPGDDEKSIDNARLDRTGLVTAHQNAMQELCDENKELKQAIDDRRQVIVELRENMKSAQQAFEKSKGDLIDKVNGLRQSLIEKGEQLARVEENLVVEQSQHLETVDIFHQKIRDIEDVKEQDDSLITTQRQEIDQLKDYHTAEISRLAQEHNSKIGRNRERIDSLTTTHRQETDQLKDTHTAEISRLAQEHNNKIGRYRERIDSLTIMHGQEIDQLQHTHTAEISRRAQEHNNEIDLYRQDIESVKTEARTERQKLQSTYEQQMAQFMDEHQGIVAQMKAELAQVTEDEGRKRQNLTASHDQQKTQLIQVHKQTLSRRDEELVQLIQDEELKISRLEEAHAAEQAQKDLNYAQGTRQLREDVKRLNAALLTRDDQLYRGELFTTSNLPTRPDEQIRGKFSEIEQMVDSLGRLQWKQEPAMWTSEVLRSIGGNRTDRVLKKAIVQDLVWCLLFNHIFCSPFRVFGAEGRLLEEEWNEQCGQDGDSNDKVFSWPEPGAKTERWRYMTVKECREVLRPPVPSEWDPRMRLRKGFMDNLRELMSELKASLEQITDLTPADIQMIERLPKKAATIWLDFAVHRCRIVIRLKDSAALSMEEKVATAKRSSLELTVIPLVGRYGNVMGADLDVFKTIDRCAGESIIMPS